MKEENEELFHTFGYVKDDRKENTTPFIDFEGKAKPESVAKTNYFKKLNEMAWAKRMKYKKGQLPEEKILLKDGLPGTVRLITRINIMS